MDRRKFLELSAAGLFLSGLSPEILAMNPAFRRAGRSGKKGSYSVVMLGDTHFDTSPESVYHEGYTIANAEREAAHRKEFVRDALMWAERSPKLLKRAACLVDGSTRLALQTGDIIQGDTGSIEVHRRMLDDAFNRIKVEFPDIPLVTVAGNHDVRAKDDAFARQAYLEYMPARMSSELGVPVDSSNFSFRVGPDAFVVIDFNKPDDDKVAGLIAEASDARYLFVLIHCTVFPYDSTKYYKWYYHGKDKNPEARDRMRRLLAENNAIVLCGHTHTTEFLDWYGDGGRITQMTMNSVWRDDATGVYEIQSEGAAQYGRKASQPVFDEFRPGIRAYSHSIAAGSYKMNVSDEGVTVDFYPGDSTRAAHRFVLR